jgi:hypothetical protein
MERPKKANGMLKYRLSCEHGDEPSGFIECGEFLDCVLLAS